MPEPSLTTAPAPRPDRIVLIGVARSGTSWLGRASSRARGVRFYYEPDNVDADPTGARPAGGRGFGPYPMIEPDADGSAFQPLWDLVFSGRSPFSASRGRMRWAASAALRVPKGDRDPVLRRVAALSTRLPGGPEQVVVKTIYALFSLEWLTRRYRPQVIAMQRNPLNVVSSWRQLGIPLFDLASRPEIARDYIQPLGIGAAPDGPDVARIAWHVGLLTHVIGDAVDRHPEWHLVTHEDLCVDPAVSMHELFDRVGLVWTDEVATFLSESNRAGEGLEPVRVTAEQPDRWRKRLTDTEVEQIDQVLARFPRRGWVRMPAPMLP